MESTGEFVDELHQLQQFQVDIKRALGLSEFSPKYVVIARIEDLLHVENLYWGDE